MAKSNPADVIDAYRRRQERRLPFTFADVSTALLFLFILVSSVYVAITGGPKLPVLVELKTNTPTLTPSITPTPSATPTITSTPTETPGPDKQCTCSSPEILVVTATFGVTNTLAPLPTESDTATVVLIPSPMLIPAETPTPSNTATPTPTSVVYTVQRGDTLGGIALKFGVTVEAIQALNNLGSTMIYVGEVLQIPAP